MTTERVTTRLSERFSPKRQISTLGVKFVDLRKNKYVHLTWDWHVKDVEWAALLRESNPRVRATFYTQLVLGAR